MSSKPTIADLIEEFGNDPQQVYLMEDTLEFLRNMEDRHNIVISYMPVIKELLLSRVEKVMIMDDVWKTADICEKELVKAEQHIADLEAEIDVLRKYVPYDGICRRHPKGERCCLPCGHEGGCKWSSGD